MRTQKNERPQTQKRQPSSQSLNFFQETFSLFCNRLGFSDDNEKVDKKSDSSNQKNNLNSTESATSYFRQSEIQHIIHLRKNLLASLQTILEGGKHDQTYSFLTHIAKCALSINEDEDKIKHDSSSSKRHELFISLVEEIEQNILPPNFGLLQLKTSLALLFCDETFFSSLCTDLKGNVSELKMVEEILNYSKEGVKESSKNIDVNESLFLNVVAFWLGRKGDKVSILRILFALSSEITNTQGFDLSSLKVINMYSKLNEQNCKEGEDENDMDQMDENDILMADVDRLVDLSYRLAIAVHILDDFVDGQETGAPQSVPKIPPNSLTLRALANSLLELSQQKSDISYPNQMMKTQTNNEGKKRTISFKTFVDWHNDEFPFLASSYPAWIRRMIFPRLLSKHSYSPFRLFPQVTEKNDSNKFSSYSPQMYIFVCASKDFHGKWHKLYSSDVDGLSSNRLQLALFGYNGPTIMIITHEDGKFGAYTTSRWKESNDFYGSDGSCFLFQMEPNFKMMHPLASGRSKCHFNYCKIKGPFAAGQARGIGFGGTVKKPRLFLSESFENCHALNQDSTFNKGDLLPPKVNAFGDLMPQKNFEIDCLEVWGVGGDEVVQKALGAQNQHRAVADASLQKARKVDKSQFLNDFQSGLIESKAFVHREQIRGRDAG